MAHIQMTEALSSALIVRFQAEYGQQAVSNFALDILLDSANAELLRLKAEIVGKDELNTALMERVRLSEKQIEDMKRAADPKRAEIMGAADKVKKLQAENHGANSHTK